MIGDEASPERGLSRFANGDKKLPCAKLFGTERLLARKLLAPKSSGLNSSAPATKQRRQLSSSRKSSADCFRAATRFGVTPPPRRSLTSRINHLRNASEEIRES
jgi:hypothetical protein